MKLPVINLLLLVSLSAVQGFFSYDGYKVYQIETASSTEVELLRVFEDDQRFDFWSKHRTHKIPFDIMVSPYGQDEFEEFLSENGISYQIIIDNFEQIVQKERESKMKSRVASGEVSFTEYMRHDEINAYLNRLAQDYPDIVTTAVIGRSFEGRDIILIKISSGTPNAPTIFADAGIHAREWIAPSLALYIINQLVENPDNRHLYENVDWVFVPLANPDGYEYTHTTQRMWRKTRSSGTLCFGADPNRNFGYHWGESGSSSFQCSDTYAGRAAFSEVEVQAIRTYILAHSQNIVLYIAIHSYGNWVLYPWSYDYVLPDDADELQTVGELFNDAVYAAAGYNYTVGNSALLLYASAGCSDDFAKGSAGVGLSYTVELPGGGSQGFDLPASRIFQVVQETWQGFKAFHGYVENKFAEVAPIDESA